MPVGEQHAAAQQPTFDRRRRPADPVGSAALRPGRRAAGDDAGEVATARRSPAAASTTRRGSQRRVDLPPRAAGQRPRPPRVRHHLGARVAGQLAQPHQLTDAEEEADGIVVAGVGEPAEQQLAAAGDDGLVQRRVGRSSRLARSASGDPATSDGLGVGQAVRQPAVPRPAWARATVTPARWPIGSTVVVAAGRSMPSIGTRRPAGGSCAGRPG